MGISPTGTTRRLARALSLAALTLTAGAPAAGAADLPSLDGPDGRRAFATAESYWGSLPCGGQVDVSWVTLDDEGNNATARWSSDGAQNFNCRVELNTSAEWDADKLCTIVVHEYGHLQGLGHTDDPRDVMSEFYTGDIPACRTPPAPPQAEPAAAATDEVPAPAQAKRRPALDLSCLRAAGRAGVAVVGSPRCRRWAKRNLAAERPGKRRALQRTGRSTRT